MSNRIRRLLWPCYRRVHILPTSMLRLLLSSWRFGRGLGRFHSITFFVKLIAVLTIWPIWVTLFGLGSMFLITLFPL
ncbi:hypothetical protein LINPERHAP2_LOCUS39005 [Linum perenne]